MHRDIREYLEDVLAGDSPPAAQKHLDQCTECCSEIRDLRSQAALFSQLRGPEVEPRPGFYARVIERIGNEGPGSIWNLFIESAFGRRIAVAAFSLALLLGAVLFTMERGEPVLAGDPAGYPQFLHTPDVASTSPGVSPNADLFTADQPIVQSVSSGGTAGPDNMIPDQVIFSMDLSANDAASNDEILANMMTYREQ